MEKKEKNWAELLEWSAGCCQWPSWVASLDARPPASVGTLFTLACVHYLNLKNRIEIWPGTNFDLLFDRLFSSTSVSWNIFDCVFYYKHTYGWLKFWKVWCTVNERTTDVIHVLIICAVLILTKRWNITCDKLRNQRV